jgi:hypothetical protein
MSEMIERVARAMALKDRGSDQWDSMADGHSQYGEDGLFKADYLDLARAAIEAMREPTEAMKDIIEGNAYIQGGLDDCNKHDIPHHSWHLMIEAALGEKVDA